MGFFLTRTDGTIVRFHTNFSNNKVELAKVSATQELPKPPEKGKGKSDGRGTYRRKTAGNYDTILRSPQGTNTGGAAASAVAGGGDASAVAEPRLGNDAVAPPPGIEDREHDQRGGWHRGWNGAEWNGNDEQQQWWTNEAWHGWQGSGAEWQDRGTRAEAWQPWYQ